MIWMDVAILTVLLTAIKPRTIRMAHQPMTIINETRYRGLLLNIEARDV